MVRDFTLTNAANYNLDNLVTVYVPHTVERNIQANNASWVEFTLVKLSQLFGGASSYDGIGAWIDASHDNELIQEHITYCYSYCDDTSLQANGDKLAELCAVLRDKLGQSAVSLVINGRLYFI